jgi:hypothetical protein
MTDSNEVSSEQKLRQALIGLSVFLAAFASGVLSEAIGPIVPKAILAVLSALGFGVGFCLVARDYWGFDFPLKKMVAVIACSLGLFGLVVVYALYSRALLF